MVTSAHRCNREFAAATEKGARAVAFAPASARHAFLYQPARWRRFLSGMAREGDLAISARNKGMNMPRLSRRINNIIPAGKDGWELHCQALARHQSGEDILMLSVGDHEFPTPRATVDACIEALNAGHHHYTQLAGLPRLRRAM